MTGICYRPARRNCHQRGGQDRRDEISFVVIHSFSGIERKLVYRGKVALNEIQLSVKYRAERGNHRSLLLSRGIPHGMEMFLFGPIVVPVELPPNR